MAHALTMAHNTSMMRSTCLDTCVHIGVYTDTITTKKKKKKRTEMEKMKTNKNNQNK